MDIVNLMFALIGHVLASVLYVVKKIAFSPPKAAIDRSSIIDRKEELIQLWEKKMANEQAAVQDETPKLEDFISSVHRNNVAAVHQTANGTLPYEYEQSSSVDAEKIPNGDAIKIESDLYNNNIEESESESEILNKSINEVQEANVLDLCSVKSDVEEVHSSTVVTSVVEHTEKTFTSTLEQTLIITENGNTHVEKVETETKITSQNIEDQEFEELERRIEAEELDGPIDMQDQKSVKDADDSVDLAIEAVVQQEHETVAKDEPEVVYQPEKCLEDIGQQTEYQCVEDVIFVNEISEKEALLNGSIDKDMYRSKDSIIEHEGIKNEEVEDSTTLDKEEKSFDDQFVLETRELESPVSDRDESEKVKKSGPHLAGVQKTEQPYSVCTTETKIAMEIREMREREEELKVMRERQAQLSPVPPVQKTPPVAKPASPVQKAQYPVLYSAPLPQKPNATPGYRVSSVFGHRTVVQQQKEEVKREKNYKESAVEREIRLAKDREEELRKQKGLPPREDDSYVKPSQVKSAQAKVFGKLANAENSRLLATAKIQNEIEEQTQREMALRESGQIQTLSTERTDAKVTKLKALEAGTPECTSPTFLNGNSYAYSNGSANGHISPDCSSKRSTPSPTGSNYSNVTGMGRPIVMNTTSTKTVNMQKFIASKGKETTFSAPKNYAFNPKTEYQEPVSSRQAIPDPGKLKRTVSVESKIQQEILEMKLREEELKLLHSGMSQNGNDTRDGHNGIPNSPGEYQNGQGEMEDHCPRRNNLIAQWEQRIQNAEGRT